MRYILVLLLIHSFFRDFSASPEKSRTNDGNADTEDETAAAEDTTGKRNETGFRPKGSRRQQNRGPKVLVRIGSRSYARQNLLSFEEIPLEMVYDRDGNLFFTKVDLNSDAPMVTVMVRNGTSRFRRVRGLKNGQGTAVGTDGSVYFATSNGIFVLDKVENVAKPYALKGRDIFEIFIDRNGTKYIISASSYAVHLLSDSLAMVPYSKVALADSISVDYFDNVYYLHNGFVYMLKGNATNPRRIRELYRDSLSQIAYDSRGNVYIAYGGGVLYSEAGSDSFARVKKIFGGPTAIAFDKDDNFALGYRKKVYKFNQIRTNLSDSIA